MNSWARTAALCLVFLAACGGGGGGGNGGGGGANRAPTFTSPNAASVAENATGAIYTAAATDPDGDAITYSISGADAALFSINASSGALSFLAPPDFEAPADAGANNVYNVSISAFDGALSTSLALAITVTDLSGLGARRVGAGFNQPLFILGAADGAGRLFVVEKGGLVRILDPATGAINATPFLTAAGLTTNGERGLLGMALAPDYAASRNFYVFATGADGRIEVRRYRRSAANASIADPAADAIFTAAHSANSNHNGGWIGFGPDNLLYFGIGDGGGGGDPNGNGQNPNTPLGAMLRIDPSSDAFPADAERDYAIPPGNPFAGGGGLAEIFHWGLRNPFRASFDRNGNGDLYIGDVGQGGWEEIDVVNISEGGRNFGWNFYEATHTYAGGAAAGLTFPVAEYAHGSGSSVTGGYVYRGPVAALQGQYFFADYIQDRMWSVDSAAFEREAPGTIGTPLVLADFTDRTAEFAPDAGANAKVATFGEDDAGNLYFANIVTGDVFAIVETD